MHCIYGRDQSQSPAIAFGCVLALDVKSKSIGRDCGPSVISRLSYSYIDIIIFSNMSAVIQINRLITLHEGQLAHLNQLALVSPKDLGAAYVYFGRQADTIGQLVKRSETSTAHPTQDDAQPTSTQISASENEDSKSLLDPYSSDLKDAIIAPASSLTADETSSGATGPKAEAVCGSVKCSIASETVCESVLPDGAVRSPSSLKQPAERTCRQTAPSDASAEDVVSDAPHGSMEESRKTAEVQVTPNATSLVTTTKRSASSAPNVADECAVDLTAHVHEQITCSSSEQLLERQAEAEAVRRLSRSQSGRVEVLPSRFEYHNFDLNGGVMLNQYGHKEWHRYEVPFGGVYSVSVYGYLPRRLHMAFRCNFRRYCFDIPAVGRLSKKRNPVFDSAVVGTVYVWAGLNDFEISHNEEKWDDSSMPSFSFERLDV